MSEPTPNPDVVQTAPGGGGWRFLVGVVILIAWGVIYWQLGFLHHCACELLHLDRGSRLGQAVQFFLFETSKVFLLLTGVVFLMGVVRSFFSPERTRQLLCGRHEFGGNVLAALLGVVTPFCSCSAVPLFIGFVTTGVPLGVTFSFLIAAPMVNEIALGLLVGLFGWKVAALYLGTGLAVALVAGWVIGRLRMERFVEEWAIQQQAAPEIALETKTWPERIRCGTEAVREIVGKIWLYVVLGIAVGAGIHGYAPVDLIAAVMGRDAWWSVPVAVLIGVPIYSNAAGILPVIHALLNKGAALGTVLAFMMSVTALSLPEAIILRKVLKLPLLALFFGTVTLGIILVGFLFNFLVDLIM